MTITVIDHAPIYKKGLISLLQEQSKETTFIEQSYLTDKPVRNTVQSAVFMISTQTIQAEKKSFESVIKLFKEGHPESRLIFYGQSDDFHEIVLYFRHGISGYFSLYSSLEEITKCITEVSKGSFYIPSSLFIKALGHYLHDGNAFAGLGQQMQLLSKREQEVASSLITGMTITEIARKLAKKPSTISTFKKRIMQKMKVNNVVELKEAMTESPSPGFRTSPRYGLGIL